MLEAVISTNVDGLRQLLSLGVDPCFKDNEGKSPLHVVCGMCFDPSRYNQLGSLKNIL